LFADGLFADGLFADGLVTIPPAEGFLAIILPPAVGFLAVGFLAVGFGADGFGADGFGADGFTPVPFKKSDMGAEFTNPKRTSKMERSWVKRRNEIILIGLR
jgi:hypothetical protein